MRTVKDLGKVVVLMGGTSAERPVSLKSGQMVLNALLASGVEAIAFDPAEQAWDTLIAAQVDCAFIALHGRFGEDGTVQGALEVLGVPYTGSGVLGSALAMDKLRSKQVWLAQGLPTPAFVLLQPDTDLHAVAAQLGFPIMVKPASEGSSIGMSKVHDVTALSAAYTLAAKYDPVVIAERCIVGTELTAGILGHTALPLIRLETQRAFYDYEAKYVADDTKYVIPCGLPAPAEEKIQALCLRAFAALGCYGWGRVDLMLDAAGDPWLLEVNTAPGMTDHSLVPMAARAFGLSYAQLCLRILELAKARHVG
jgi:D-alanine-D-alanine ligase